jgi:transposase
VCGLEASTVDVVTPDRRTDSLAAYYDTLTEAQRAALQAVAMDMWPAYIRATTDGLPQGDQKMVFDRFHIMREMTGRSIRYGRRSIVPSSRPGRPHR